MQIFAELKNDHGEILEQLKWLTSDVQKMRGLGRPDSYLIESFINFKLSLHAHFLAEEEAFYRNVLSHDVTHAATLQSLHEHRDIEALMTTIEENLKSGANWSAHFDHLSNLIERHFGREETDVFQKAKSVVSTQDGAAMAVHFSKAESALDSRLEQVQTPSN